ncbi:MAG: Asp-tRNA(Asn)/Glu-tRNA(Gln) amidotransferase subunit GatB [Candidatus Micrarchaeota archaeon]|nr:Asp-tRNA(Asn)/Glu-tRNA(Gln) amidotransferase subunit GatB [Candidatus Micrarchaeota archaeon]
MKFESDTVIGLEIHLGLATKTKLFCSCPTQGSDEPNTRVCPVCLGHPASMPVANKKAIEYAIRLCIWANAKIAPQVVFSRKTYFYPDLAKNYQITQYEMPLGSGGMIELPSSRKIKLSRLHVEEDPAALVHAGGMQDAEFTLVDYNRSGMPLVEIVTEPVIESPAEAREFMKKLVTMATLLDVFDIDKCIIKADANISIRESGYERVEIKNIFGFKEIESALSYEIERQRKIVSSGGKVTRETRGWDAERQKTFSLRSKETEEEYGYIIDTDLVPIDIERKWIEEIKSTLPEHIDRRIERYQREYGIKKEDAEIIAGEKRICRFFEIVAGKVDPIIAVNWVRVELLGLLNSSGKALDETQITPDNFAELLQLFAGKKITNLTAKEILKKMENERISPKEYVSERGLEMVSDDGEIRKLCREAIKENPKAVLDYANGNEKSLNFLIGSVMKKKKASPQMLRDILIEMLKEE